MMSDKILIIDDKLAGEDFSTAQLLSLLNEEQKYVIDYAENTESLWIESKEGDDITLVKNFSQYSFIFIHDSFEDPLVNDGLKAIVIEKLSDTSIIILFSGGKSESANPRKLLFDSDISEKSSYFEIRRREYFYNLKNFIDGYLLTGQFEIKYLYQSELNPKKDKAYDFLESIKNDLEESLKKAIESESFKSLLTLYGYLNIAEISNRFSTLTDDDFIERLENLIENN